MSNYSTLEEAYGSPFGQRIPVTHARKDLTSAKAEFTSISQKSEESIKKFNPLLASIQGTLPLDTAKETENFVSAPVKVDPTPVPRPRTEQFRVRENFQTGDDYNEKLNRILRLIEQNRTGYERPATQDMVLYIFTGVFFLFTFDTFVMLGKAMRRH